MTPGLTDQHMASIDIGSHTIRMLAARLEENRRIVPLVLERRITRLAKDFHDGETLKQPGMEKSLSTLREYCEILQRAGVDSVNCGATGVLRRAENSASFLRAVEEITGFRVAILSESSEAYLSAKGTLSVLPAPQRMIVSFDCGGSSTEFLLVDTETGEVLWDTSVFMGAATITDQYLSGNPTRKSSVIQAKSVIRQLLVPVVSAIKSAIGENSHPPGSYQLVGTAGTVTTLAAMLLEMEIYEPYRVNGVALTRDWLEGTVELLVGMPVDARRHLTGLEEGREDIILGGTLIVEGILGSLQQNQFLVTDGGLLEGLFLDLAERQLGWPSRLLTPLTWQMPEVWRYPGERENSIQTD